MLPKDDVVHNYLQWINTIFNFHLHSREVVKTNFSGMDSAEMHFCHPLHWVTMVMILNAVLTINTSDMVFK